MTPQQFQAALHQLGLSHRGAAAFLGYQERHIRRLVAGECPIPPYIAKLLAVMVAKKLSPRKVDKLSLIWEAHPRDATGPASGIAHGLEIGHAPERAGPQSRSPRK